MMIRKYLIKYTPFVTIIVILCMLLSLKYHFLNSFLSGCNKEGVMGDDYFSIPEGFLYLLLHKSMFYYHRFNTLPIPYAPYIEPYVFHPLIAITFGAILSCFKPFIGYGIFVFLSLAMLSFSAYLISKQTPDPLIKRLSYLFIFCAFPVYLMLWLGQIHVLTIMAFAFLFAGILEILNKPKLNQRKYYPKIVAGLLISLLSKPMVLLAFPVLLLTKETRKSTLLSLGIYVIVSGVLLFTPFLNPQHVSPLLYLSALSHAQNACYYNQLIGFDNFKHWTNMLCQSQSIAYNPELFSLSAFLKNFPGFSHDPSWWLPLLKIPVYLVFLISLSVFWIQSQQERLKTVILIIILSIYSYYLSYTLVWEYQYTTISPTLPVLMILYQEESSQMTQKFMSAVIYTSLFLYLPTLYFLYQTTYASHFVAILFLRTVPITLMYCFLLLAIGSKILPFLKKRGIYGIQFLKFLYAFLAKKYATRKPPSKV